MSPTTQHILPPAPRPEHILAKLCRARLQITRSLQHGQVDRDTGGTLLASNKAARLRRDEHSRSESMTDRERHPGEFYARSNHKDLAKAQCEAVR